MSCGGWIPPELAGTRDFPQGWVTFSSPPHRLQMSQQITWTSVQGLCYESWSCNAPGKIQNYDNADTTAWGTALFVHCYLTCKMQ